MPTLKDFAPENLSISNPETQLHHIFNEADIYALWAAYSAGRPLLVRGKPGTGKSQMARAIAERLGWAFVSEVIRGSTELSDLHWHFDAIARLGEAQARSISDKENQSSENRLDPINFLAPGAFWWAFSWASAAQQYQRCPSHLRPAPKPPTHPNWQAESGGVVLLLDEIDKAEPDLPNGLLETLGQYQFTAPYIDRASNPISADPKRLLVIITTNEERELPKAFVRRCFVHTLTMEEAPEKRLSWLIDRGRLHFKTQITDEAYSKAAELLWQDRDDTPHHQYPPGLAEYIDLLTAISVLPPDEQLPRLDKIAQYALKKELLD